MIIDQRVTIEAPIERCWAVIADIPTVATCVPGVESVSAAGDDRYTGVLVAKVGPVTVRLEGQVTVVERDAVGHRAQFAVEATDRRIRGAVSATTVLQLEAHGDTTDLAIHTDVSILGKLGQFGSAVIKRKSDQIVAQFGANLSARLAQDRLAAEG
jgi:uncharacterized protein